MRGTGVRLAASVFSWGAILAYCAAASSVMLGDFAPLPMAVIWLYVVSFGAGLTMAMTHRDTGPVFGGTVLVALVGGLIFGAALAIAIVSADPRLADLAALYVFQQAFPRTMSMGVFGLMGAFLGTVVRQMLGS